MHDIFPPTGAAAVAVARRLADLCVLLEATSDADYAARPHGGVSGPVGAHVRHCLDHVNALLDAGTDGVLSYDHRHRNAGIEQDRQVGIAAVRTAVQRLETLAIERADRAVTLETQVDRDGRRVRVLSSMARELVFVLQHTIHHQALVALLLAGRGVAVPPTFGFAPSTPRPAR